MLSFLNKYARNVHSQEGEDGIVEECLSRIPIINRVCVEIGGNDGLWLSNTRHLIEQGWTGTFVETEWGLYLKCEANWAHRSDVKCICSRVDGHNVNAFVSDKCDVLSMDTDGPDYEIFKGLKAKPRIVIVEIDSSIPPDSNEMNRDGAHGFKSMVELGTEKGYFLVAHTGNLIFVDEQYRDLFPEIVGNPLIDSETYFNRAWLNSECARVGTN